MVVKHTADLEKDKFDDNGNVKVSVQGGAGGIDVNVTNADSAPVPVKIINEDTNIDVNVSVEEEVTINDDTPVRTEVTNSYINVYNKVHDGSAWQNQFSDSSGRIYSLNKTTYTSSDITALGSSTDITTWLSAYNDGQLTYKYVDSYDDEFEQEVYLTHPDLGDSNKSLKLVYTYTTQNTEKVVESVFAAVKDWTFDDDVTGTVTLTLGSATSPDPSSAITVGTDVISSVTIANTGSGTLTLSLSGSDAVYYQINNTTTTTTGSSVAVTTTDTVVIETASDFSGSSYSHSVTVTLTNDYYGNSDSETFATSGTYNSFTNAKYHDVVATAQNATNYTWGGLDTTTTAVADKTVKHAFHGLGYQRTGGNADKLGYPNYDEDYTWSMWINFGTLTGGLLINAMRVWDLTNTNDSRWINIYLVNTSGDLRLYGDVGYDGSAITVGANSTLSGHSVSANTWHNITCTRDASANDHKIYWDGSLVYTDTYSSTDSNNTNITNPWARSNDTTSNGYRCNLFDVQFALSSQDFDIDEVSTWNTALPATGSLSVSSIYNSGTPANLAGSSGLIGWWRMGDGDNGSGTNDSTSTVHDMSGNDNHITIRAAAPTVGTY